MKTYLECVREAADKMKAVSYYNSYQAILDYLRPILQEAADIYASQSNSHKHSVMQAEASAGAVGAAVGQRSVDTVVERELCDGWFCHLSSSMFTIHPKCKDKCARKSSGAQP